MAIATTRKGEKEKGRERELVREGALITLCIFVI